MKKLILAILLSVVGFGNAQASITLYTDHAAWEAASGGGTGNIVDNLNAGEIIRQVVDRTTYTIAGTTLAFFPNTNPTTSIDGTGYVRFLLDASNYGILTFNAPIMSLGFGIHPWCNGGDCNYPNSMGAAIAVAIDGIASTSYLLPATNVSEFRGFVSDTPFTTFKITTTAQSGWHGMDNLEAFSVSAIPIPGAIWMFVSGLLGFVALRKKGGFNSEVQS